MDKKIRVTVWNENLDEHRHPETLKRYPGGLHCYIPEYLNREPDIVARGVTFQDEDFGVPDSVLDDTDVMVLYSHMAQDMVSDERAEAVVDRVANRGMGLILLHSAISMKAVRRLLGPGGFTGYREVGEKERVWVTKPAHPIAEGLPPYFEFPQSEVYLEPGSLAREDDLIFISWYQGGAAARTGMTWQHGDGKIFWFSPGHLTFDIMNTDIHKKIILNAIRWAAPKFRIEYSRRTGDTPALEPLG